MKKQKYMEQQIDTLLKDVELDAKVNETCRETFAKYNTLSEAPSIQIFSRVMKYFL